MAPATAPPSGRARQPYQEIRRTSPDGRLGLPCVGFQVLFVPSDNLGRATAIIPRPIKPIAIRASNRKTNGGDGLRPPVRHELGELVKSAADLRRIADGADFPVKNMGWKFAREVDPRRKFFVNLFCPVAGVFLGEVSGIIRAALDRPGGDAMSVLGHGRHDAFRRSCTTLVVSSTPSHQSDQASMTFLRGPTRSSRW
jgi:hypothetical protein